MRVFQKFSSLLVAAALGSVLMAGSGQAAPLSANPALDGQRGVAVSQRFLPQGAAIVTTADGRSCVVSRRILIEDAVYRGPDGQLVAFDMVRRSMAASVQAVAAADGAPPAFRIQLKYSLAPGAPVILTLGGQAFDLQATAEPSTDSLWITGAPAAALAAAFRAGDRPVLTATSLDTARHVTDRLEPPDLAALDSCRAELAAAAPAPLLTNAIRVTFRADPATAPLATLPQLQTCGMTDRPGQLHLAQLQEVTGFFAQTDKIFVSFDDAGDLAQVYIPGIFDGDFRHGGHQARLSRASDGNVPQDANGVKGCLGAETVDLCQTRMADGTRLLGDCLDTGGLGTPPAPPVELATLFPPGSSGGAPVRGGGGGGGGGGGSSSIGGGGGGGGGGDPDPEDPDPPPVPLPAPLLLLGTALLGLAAARRARRG